MRKAIEANKARQEARTAAIEHGEIVVEDPRERKLRELAQAEADKKANKKAEGKEKPQKPFRKEQAAAAKNAPSGETGPSSSSSKAIVPPPQLSSAASKSESVPLTTNKLEWQVNEQDLSITLRRMRYKTSDFVNAISSRQPTIIDVIFAHAKRQS